MTHPVAGEVQTIASTVIRWNVRPPKRFASSVRELVSDSYQGLLDTDEALRIAMAAHEMVENLVKYSSDGKSSFEVEICDSDGRRYVRLRSRNSAAPEDLQGATRLIERIQSAADPVAIYDQLIAESPGRAGSGLGLARIRAEAEMDIACSAEGSQFTVVAERRVSLHGTP
jgi:hypothetical protein